MADDFSRHISDAKLCSDAAYGPFHEHVLSGTLRFGTRLSFQTVLVKNRLLVGGAVRG